MRQDPIPNSDGPVRSGSFGILHAMQVMEYVCDLNSETKQLEDLSNRLLKATEFKTVQVLGCR